MVRHSAFPLLIVLSAATAFARGNLKELTVPLKFTPQEGVHASIVNMQPAMLSTSVAITVQDARKESDALVIGTGTGGDDKPFPIHADRPVAPFVQEITASVAKDWGLQQSASPARALVLQLTRFYLDESNKAVGSVYGAEVKFAYTLKDAKGAVLADGAAAGTAHRYGRAHSPDNCNEVLSDALKEALANVISNADLQQAWMSGKHVATTQAQTKESPEERLRRLDDMLKKGLITKDEYAQKRAEILKDM